jgi:hypothetical protein
MPVKGQPMTVDQASVLERAGSAIQNNPYLMQKKVRLTVDGDCLCIQGNVSSYFQKQMLQETLREIAKPLRIVNEVVVSYDAVRPDWTPLINNSAVA